MHPTQVLKVGPFSLKVNVGEIQSMVFTTMDKGPNFNPTAFKHPKKSSTKEKKNKTKEVLVEEMKKQDMFSKKYLSIEEVKSEAVKKKINLERTYLKIRRVWLGQEKGLLKFLWERGLLDPKKE